ncbi:hypothetical protein I4F81_008181 [Pyropia yezoensis]|uniref:Uncharacterized protein n=1 Tax=Pyropia yezoensis TaxID=2788 RepID=A0ACC3C661_PYRYE|nr:hypothetical protein I4F81_008181 [Neopyropia yezoensis]
MPMGRSPGSPSGPTPPGLARSRRSAPARACAAAAGTRVTAASDTSSSNTPTSASCPPPSSAHRCSTRRPDGPGAAPRGARRMASVTASRVTPRGTVAASPKSAASARRSPNSASTDAAEVGADAAGGKRRSAFRHTAALCGAGSSATRARAAALSRPARTRRSARRWDGASAVAAWSPPRTTLRRPSKRRRHDGRHTPALRSARAVLNSPFSTASARTWWVSGGSGASGAVAGATAGTWRRREGSSSSHSQACCCSGSRRTQSRASAASTLQAPSSAAGTCATVRAPDATRGDQSAAVGAARRRKSARAATQAGGSAANSVCPSPAAAAPCAAPAPRASPPSPAAAAGAAAATTRARWRRGLGRQRASWADRELRPRGPRCARYGRPHQRHPPSPSSVAVAAGTSPITWA